MSDDFDLERFVQAQSGVHEQALAELRAGGKRSHWMWFVFPQVEGLGRSATAQQYAVVVSNPQNDVAANVVIEQDDAAPGEPPSVSTVAKARVLPSNLEVFLLGPRWVDGSTDINGTGETHTAVTRHAYKITSDVPIIAYQFNPLENVNVFSNDASLLKPVEAIGGSGRPSFSPGSAAPAWTVGASSSTRPAGGRLSTIAVSMFSMCCIGPNRWTPAFPGTTSTFARDARFWKKSRRVLCCNWPRWPTPCRVGADDGRVVTRAP